MNHISIKLFLSRIKVKMKAKSFDSWLGLKANMVEREGNIRHLAFLSPLKKVVRRMAGEWEFVSPHEGISMNCF